MERAGQGPANMGRPSSEAFRRLGERAGARVGSVAAWSTRSPADRGSVDPFALLPRRCFCMILRLDGSGHTTPCPVRVTMEGCYTDGNGRGWYVYSCRDHSQALRDARLIVGAPRPSGAFTPGSGQRDGRDEQASRPAGDPGPAGAGA